MSLLSEGTTNDGVHTVVREDYEYGRLWPDGTFGKLTDYDEKYGRKQFDEKAYELKSVPESLRPVFGRRRRVTTIDTYPAEAVTEGDTK